MPSPYQMLIYSYNLVINSITGTLPTEMGQLKQLQELDLGEYLKLLM